MGKVLVSMGIEQRFVSPDNAYSTPRGDCLAYDLCPFCLMLAHPQMFLILTRNIDILTFFLSHNCSRITIFNTLIIGRPRRQSSLPNDKK